MHIFTLNPFWLCILNVRACTPCVLLLNQKGKTRLRQLPSHFPAEAPSGVTHAASRLGGQMEFMASRCTDKRATVSVTVLPDMRRTKDATSVVMQITPRLLFKH